MPNLASNYLERQSGGSVVVVPGTWVQLTSNATGISYVSSTASDANGLFQMVNVPAGTYSVATGPTAAGPFESTNNIGYQIAPDTRWFNVLDYGADATGATDSTPAIQQALDACRVAGGGTVFFPLGTYSVITALRTGGFANNACALMPGGDTVLRGQGRGASIIRLANGSPGCSGLLSNNAAIFSPWNVSQEQVTFVDLTIDGNAGNNGADTINGVFIWRQRNWKFHRVQIKDCRGTANSGGAAETFMFYGNGSSELSFVDCDGIQTTGSVSNAFVANGCTMVDYVDCRAIGIGAGAAIGYGFNVGTSAAGSRQVTYTNCKAYLCGQQGYHVDASNVQNVTYTACVAGGLASDIVSGQQFPFTQSQSLGNGGSGWVCTVAAVGIKLVGCISDNNGAHGYDLRAGQFYLDNCSGRNNAAGQGLVFSNTPTARVSGGDYSNNLIGIRFGAVADTANVRITGGPRLSGNATTAIQVNATNYAAPPANVAAPAVPASTVALTSPFGLDARVYVNGGTVTAVALDGVATGQIAGAFIVPAGGTITLTYTVAPTWTWFIF